MCPLMKPKCVIEEPLRSASIAEARSLWRKPADLQELLLYHEADELYGLLSHQAYSGAIEVGRPPLVNYDVEPLMSSVFALILNESPLLMVVFGSVPKATGSVPRYADQCVTVPTSAVAVPKSMSAVISISPLEALLMFAAGNRGSGSERPAACRYPSVGRATVCRCGSMQSEGQVRPANAVGKFV